MMTFAELERRAKEEGKKELKTTRGREAHANIASEAFDKWFLEGFVKGYIYGALSVYKTCIDDGILSLEKVLTGLGISEEKLFELATQDEK